MMVFRGSLLVTTLLIATLEPVLPTGGDEVGLLKYAITQGGLALVVLVLLWSYRRDFTRVLAEQQDRLTVMSTMIATTTAALTQAAAAQDRLARAIESLQLQQARRV